MKYFITLLLSFLIIISCNDNQEGAAATAEVDSVSAMSMSMLAAEPGQTTTVTKITKQPVWFIVVKNADGTIVSAEVVDTDPATPPPPPPSDNKPPLIKTGPDQVITKATTTLNGSGSTDPDGTIVKYEWTQSKGNPAILNTVNAVSNISGLTNGHYRFNLKITDDDGAQVSDTIHVTVSAVGTSTPPPPPPTDPPPTGSYGTIIYQTGYDKSSDIINSNNQHGAGGLSTTIFKTGPGSFRSQPADVSNGIRSEVQYSDSQTPTEGAIEYDVYYDVIVPNNGHSLQFHPHTSGGSASPGLWHVGGKFVINNWKGGSNTSHTTGVTIPSKKWLHIVLQYKFGSSGYLKLTIDGTVVLNKTGIQVGDGSGQYLKVGYNGWDGNSTSSRIYYDNLKIWKK